MCYLSILIINVKKYLHHSNKVNIEAARDTSILTMNQGILSFSFLLATYFIIFRANVVQKSDSHALKLGDKQISSNVNCICAWYRCIQYYMEKIFTEVYQLYTNSSAPFYSLCVQIKRNENVTEFAQRMTFSRNDIKCNIHCCSVYYLCNGLLQSLQSKMPSFCLFLPATSNNCI